MAGTPTTMAVKDLSEVVTPAFVVSLPVVKRNTQQMLQRAKDLGVEIRPHVKTHKTIQGAKYQLGDQSNKIVCSTLTEVEYFANDVKDIIYGVPISLEKLPKIKELSEKITLHIFVDSKTVLDGVSVFARQHKTKFSVFLCIDSGYGREGVPYHLDSTVELAKQIAADPFLIFQGIYLHAGHSYDCRGQKEIQQMSDREREVAADFAGRLKKEGVHFNTISVGSTPTCSHPLKWDGCTEIHPGNYIFYDCQQVAIGSATWDDCAATVLTSVLSHYPDRNRVLCDAGALSMSKDTSPFGDFGRIVGHPELVLKKISQEVGIIERVDSGAISENDLPIGTKLRVIPNHACLSAACFEQYHVVDEHNKVVDVWKRCR